VRLLPPPVGYPPSPWSFPTCRWLQACRR